MTVKKGGGQTGETYLRSLVKTISWRTFATLTTMLLVLIFTGELVLAAGIAALEVVSKMILYFVHERMWNRIRWGYADTTEEIPKA